MSSAQAALGDLSPAGGGPGARIRQCSGATEASNEHLRTLFHSTVTSPERPLGAGGLLARLCVSSTQLWADPKQQGPELTEGGVTFS